MNCLHLLQKLNGLIVYWPNSFMIRPAISTFNFSWTLPRYLLFSLKWKCLFKNKSISLAKDRHTIVKRLYWICLYITRSWVLVVSAISVISALIEESFFSSGLFNTCWYLLAIVYFNPSNITVTNLLVIFSATSPYSSAIVSNIPKWVLCLDCEVIVASSVELLLFCLNMRFLNWFGNRSEVALEVGVEDREANGWSSITYWKQVNDWTD